MGKLQSSRLDRFRGDSLAQWQRSAWLRLRDQFDFTITASGLLGAFMYLVGRVFYALRLVLLMALLWLRGLVLMIAHGVAGLSLAAFVVMLIVTGVGSGSFSGVFDRFWPFLLMSFGLFVVGWLYDGLILLIAGDDDLALFH